MTYYHELLLYYNNAIHFYSSTQSMRKSIKKQIHKISFIYIVIYLCIIMVTLVKYKQQRIPNFQIIVINIIICLCL